MRGHARASRATIIGALMSVAVAFVSPLASLVLYLAIGSLFIVLRLRDHDDEPASAASG